MTTDQIAAVVKKWNAVLDNDDDLLSCNPLIIESRPSPFYRQESSQFWFLHFEKHSLSCPCSYCEPRRWKPRFSWGVSLPENKSWNSWRMVWAIGREWRYYVRWLGFWKAQNV